MMGRTGPFQWGDVVQVTGPKQRMNTIVLTEGKKREVRRICRAVGLRVQQLKRITFAGIHLGDLPPGALRPLDRGEIDHLYDVTGLER